MIGHGLQSFLQQAQLNDSYQCNGQSSCRTENMDSMSAVEQLPLQKSPGEVCPEERQCAAKTALK